MLVLDDVELPDCDGTPFMLLKTRKRRNAWLVTATVPTSPRKMYEKLNCHAELGAVDFEREAKTPSNGSTWEATGSGKPGALE